MATPPESETATVARRQVEAAFLASTAALLWLLSFTPLLPLVRLLFPLPVALAVLRWDPRTGAMTVAVATLLLTLLIGPTRSVLYCMPYGILGWQCGRLWRQQRSWYRSLADSTLLMTLGLIFQLSLSSLLVGENLWSYVTLQLTGLTNGLLSWLGLEVVAPLLLVQGVIVGFIAFNSLIYALTMHLIAAMLMERLQCPLPLPPPWLMALL
ncbi:MAG: DUF2232 domain-containing protein [Thermostichales cyanobacterium SZTDM-1c_bins_54]